MLATLLRGRAQRAQRDHRGAEVLLVPVARADARGDYACYEVTRRQLEHPVPITLPSGAVVVRRHEVTWRLLGGIAPKECDALLSPASRRALSCAPCAAPST